MKKRIKEITEHPVAQHTLRSLKPEKSLWGILGVVFFFIAPEIVAYFFGEAITVYAKESLMVSSSWVDKYTYEMLITLFEEGVSWLNVSIGSVLLVWLFF